MTDVVKYPDPILSLECADVTVFDQELKALVDHMAETMYATNGVGLAANQVGLSRRLILVDPSGGEVSSELVAFVNPSVTWSSPERDLAKEGCLSLPGALINVSRPIACDVVYLDLDGMLRSMRCTGYRARIVQHEIDHLLGLTMLDRVDSYARRIALGSMSHNKR